MHKRILIPVVLIAGLAGLTHLCAADSAIGVATANGGFRLNNAQVSGNATVFAGSVIETSDAASRVRLNDGSRIEIGAQSRVKILKDRLVLESGTSNLEASDDYEIEASSFRIAPATSDSVARVARAGEKIVEVAALHGSLRVLSAHGLQIANVYPGVALSFEPQAGGSAPPANHLGCLLKKESKYIIYDQTTRIIVELRGSFDFESELGNRVHVIGTTDTSATSDIAAQVVAVTSLNRYGVGGCQPVAEAIGAEGAGEVAATTPAATSSSPASSTTAPSGQSGGGGISAGVVVLILAAGGGGAAAAVVLSQSGNDRSP